MLTRRLAAVAALMALSAAAPAQTARYTVELTVRGHLIVSEDGKPQELKLDSKARHRFTETALAAADGLPVRSARLYEEAVSSTVAGTEKTDRRLPDDRRVIAVRRGTDGLFAHAPAGPLTRDELGLVAEHFPPHALPGLLPPADAKPGDTWKVGPAAAQAAGGFDGLLAHDLTGKLVSLADGKGAFELSGTASGVENGAEVKLKVTATGTFDAATRQVLELQWRQEDDRGAGPANPASKVEATISLKAEPVAAPPELTGDTVAGLAADPPPAATLLRHADPKGRYQFVYPREWHVTGHTDTHLLMRLIDRGEFVAQVTVTPWKKSDPGKHADPADFKKAVAELPGWAEDRVLTDEELPADGGRWVYRRTAQGRLDDTEMVQSFHLVAGPQGHHLAVTTATRPDKFKALAGRDVQFVYGIELPK